MTNKKITITINGQKCSCVEGDKVLQVAIENKIDIPHFCYHEDFGTGANCRICLVDAGGKITTSCTLRAKEGLCVTSKKPAVKKLVQKNLQLLLADHKEGCPRCRNGSECKTANTMREYEVTGKEYSRPQINAPIHKMGTAAEFDPNQCIDCNKCVMACKKIGIGFLELKNSGANTKLDYTDDKCVDCIYCGQCTVSCPVMAVREQGHIEDVMNALRDKDKIVIAQIAPSIRCSIGEEFGEEPGGNYMGETYTALRELGFDKIFDVNMGADITTIVEARELVHRIQNGGVLPMFTSCCPGWVKFVEFYHPELIPNLTTSRSPQIHSGGCYKTYWAEKEGIDPKKIVVVSIMPCTSKKYEASMKKFNVKGMKPVDYVLTTREFARILKNKKIDLPKLKKSKVDEFGTFSGAAAIYGASGGVMESALRSAYFYLTGKELKNVEFKQVRGYEGVKKANIKINGKTLKVAVVSTAKNAKIIIEELKKDPEAYHYVEVMACPGGCIGGGGQPIPSSARIVKKRIAGLYKIDDKMTLRKAHKNPIALDFFENYLDNQTEKEQSALLHTSYKKKKRFQ